MFFSVHPCFFLSLFKSFLEYPRTFRQKLQYSRVRFLARI